MTPIYLTRIAVNEFRSFGELVIDLPNAPGVLISHGPNGLGKSSLFDGLEWTLTDKVDHFRDAKKAPVSHYLRNWEAPRGAPTQIRLDFGDAYIQRSLWSGLDANGVTDVVDFLKADDWEKPIRHLDRYLLLTHFLGQSTVSRMTHRNATERWEFLQEPAQSDRAIEIVKALHGHGASTPAKTFERRSKELAEQASRLEQLLRQEEEQWSDAQLEGAIDERSAASEAALIGADLDALMAELGQAPEPVTAAPGGTLEALMARREQAGTAVRLREQRLSRGRSLIVERDAAAVALAGLEGSIAALREQAETAAPEVERARLQVETAQTRVAEALTAHQSEVAASAALQRLERARGDAARLATETEGARLLVTTLSEQLQSLEADVRKAERRREIADRLGRSVAWADARGSQIASQLEQIAVATAAIAARDQARSMVERLRSGHEDLETQVMTASSEWQAASAAAQSLHGELAGTRLSVDEMSAALAAVAARLPANSCECPLCATPFENPTELRDRVAAAVDRLAPRLAELERDLVAAEERRDQAKARFDALGATLTEIQGWRDEAAQASQDLEEALRVLGADEPRREADLPALRDQLERARAQIATRTRRTAYWLAHPVIGGASGALLAWSRATSSRNELAASLESAREALTQHEGQHREALTALASTAAAAAMPADASNDEFANARSAQLERERQAEDALASARVTLEEAERALAAARATAAQLAASIEETDDQADLLRERLAGYEEGWETLELGDDMSAEALREPLDRLPVQQGRLAALAERIQRLRDGVLAWTRQQRHRTTLDQLRSLLDLAPVAERDSIRRAATDRQSELVRQSERVLRAKAIAQEANAEVNRRVETFNRQFLEPLSQLMNRINRSILSEPEIGLDLEIGPKKVEQRAIAGSGTPDFVSKLDPKLVHSEGQMAALAVSMLTASSLTFPWSRWPALIMDDPLQHNDVVHAAAFADMLRNLVLERRYQLFLSTHDLGQAEFLRRKFRAANIPCTMVHLLGRGKRAVETRVTQSWATEAPTGKAAPPAG